MARYLRLLPRIELFVEVRKRLIGFGLDAGNVVVNIDFVFGVFTNTPEFANLALKVGDLFLEIQIGDHGRVSDDPVCGFGGTYRCKRVPSSL